MSDVQVIYVEEAATEVLVTADPSLATILTITEQGPQGPMGTMPPPESGTIVRDGDGNISQVVMDTKTVVLTRVDGVLQSVTDGTNTWTFTRDGNGTLVSWTVT